MQIPFLQFSDSNLRIKEEIFKAFQDFFLCEWYILGDRVKKFEKEYSIFNQVSFTIGTSNGLDALILSLKVLGIKEGDEVIVPSNTYIATALSVSHLGAIPIFVEPDKETYNIDVKKIENAITNKTKAIIPVHLYGQACDMESVMTIANNYGLFVVEDNAQSQGSSFDGKITGSWGHLNATSFYPGKNLGALGDAGAVTTDNEEYAMKVAVYRNYGSKIKYFNEVQGYNMRLDECQAAFLSIKLKYLYEWTQERQQIAAWYYEQLGDIKDIILPKLHSKASHVYHLYVIRTKYRDSLKQYLNDNGIGTLIHYPIPPHLQKAYLISGYKIGDFPIAEELANTCLSIPLWPGLRFEMVCKISDVIRSYFKKNNIKY